MLSGDSSTSSQIVYHGNLSPRPIVLHLCNTCGKTFDCQSKLDMHSRIHTGDQPFKCEVCERAFTQKGNLRRHMFTHRTKSTKFKRQVYE